MSWEKPCIDCGYDCHSQSGLCGECYGRKVNHKISPKPECVVITRFWNAIQSGDPIKIRRAAHLLCDYKINYIQVMLISMTENADNEKLVFARATALQIFYAREMT